MLFHHNLKLMNANWHSVKLGEKSFIIERDAGYQKGDLIFFYRHDGENFILPNGRTSPKSSGADQFERTIAWVYTGEGVEKGYAVLGLQREARP